MSLICSEFSAPLCVSLCAPLRLNFNPQFATILRKRCTKDLRLTEIRGYGERQKPNPPLEITTTHAHQKLPL
jgi:hypothetical protein